MSVIVITAACALLAACGHSDQVAVKAATKDPQDGSPVRYIRVGQQSIPDSLDLSAKVQADPTKVVRIFPPAAGRVVSIAVKPGDRVRHGETLAVLNSSDAASAKADFAKAKIEVERAARVAEREKNLFEHGASAEKDYLDAQAQSDSARAELARAQQRLDLLNVNYSSGTDRVSLTAPMNGIVLDVSAAPGEFSRSLESANPLITIADLDTVWVVGDLYEKDAAKLSPGKTVTVTLQAYDGQKWNGRIDSVAGALDPATRTLKVRVSLSNPKQLLKPEMFAVIHVNLGTRQSLVVPAGAIIREGSEATVFVNNAGKAEQRPITIGSAVDGKVEVLNGLRAGDEVAAEGAELLKGGPAE